MAKWVKDSVHGDIPLTPVAEALIDTPEMQRLRRVSQTAFCYLLYPSANHTRFEHSLGVYYLTNRGSFFQGWGGKEAELLSIAALLHDVGHSAFSHTLEPIVAKHTGKNHEDITHEKIAKGNIKEVLEEYGYTPEEIFAVEENEKGKLITGDLGTDRMDYLMRDALFTGVSYDTVDSDRLLRKFNVENNHVVYNHSVISSAESMLLSRFMMFTSVYGHHTAVAPSLMLRKAADIAITNYGLSAEKLSEWDDAQTLRELESIGGYPNNIASRLLNRRLYKLAIKKPLREFNNWLNLGDIDSEQILEIENHIAQESGIPENEVILHIPKPFFGDINVKVKKDGDYYSIGEVSFICRILKEAQLDYTNVNIFVPPEYERRVNTESLKMLESI
jgi:HD superfamily phosphohydrolase